MKNLILMAMCAGSLQAASVTCSAYIGSQSQEVVKVERVQRQDDSSFQATFFKSLVNNLFCMADAANVPGNIRCTNLNNLDPAIDIQIFSADGILNIGTMSLDGVQTNLHCSHQ